MRLWTTHAATLALAAALACGAAPDAAPPPRTREPPVAPPTAPDTDGLDRAGLASLRPAPRVGWPVERVHVTSPFGWRIDPISGTGTRLHKGTDFRGAPGDPVLSIAAGTVAFVGHDPLLGTMIVIDHGHGIQSLYAHLSGVLVHEKLPVARGAAIGLVGNTGRSEAPHLHLTVKVGGEAIDPLRLIGEPLHVGDGFVPYPAPTGPPKDTGPVETAGAPDGDGDTAAAADDD